MPDPFTRRRLAKLAAVPLLSPAQSPAQDQPADDLAIQRANLNRWREQMKQVKLPRHAEPAVIFKA
ncbi:MAG: hypothetical protein HY820_16870 [Acidobacteria bacterium]|nr:hypothetical protein [Acidobacteriota bacterium]